MTEDLRTAADNRMLLSTVLWDTEFPTDVYMQEQKLIQMWPLLRIILRVKEIILKNGPSSEEDSNSKGNVVGMTAINL
jgi:hypothetical protein